MSVTYNIRRIARGLFCAAALFFVPDISAQTFDFSNLNFVVGSGSNESALVITWNDGKTPDSLVWGYKWNMPASGTAPTIYDMMQALQAADPRLSTTANAQFNSPGTGSYGLYSVFYDLTGLGGSPTVGKPLNQGGTENGFPPFPGDHYKEGWFTGFWGEVIGIGDPYIGGSWNSTTSTHGLAVDRISNNSWYGLSFSTDATFPFTIPNPGFPTAVAPPAGTPVPVPAGASWFCFIALGGAGMFASRNRKRRRISAPR